MSKVSAPGKLLLMGEHAVVYDRPCLVTAVDTRLTVHIERSEEKETHIEAPQVNNTKFVSRVLELAAATWGVSLPPLRITTKSDFDSRFGLGSSSAVTVATLFALHELLGRKESMEALFLLARQVVLDVQGSGSGFDVAVAMFGKTLYYKKTIPIIEPLSISSMPLVVGYTGIKADTAALVADISKKREREPEKVDRIFEAIEKLVEEAKTKMVK